MTKSNLGRKVFILCHDSQVICNQQEKSGQDFQEGT